MVRGNPRRGAPAPVLEVTAGTVVCALRGWAGDAPEADDASCLAEGFGALRLVCDRLLLRGGQVGIARRSAARITFPMLPVCLWSVCSHLLCQHAGMRSEGHGCHDATQGFCNFAWYDGQDRLRRQRTVALLTTLITRSGGRSSDERQLCAGGGSRGRSRAHGAQRDARADRFRPHGASELSRVRSQLADTSRSDAGR